MNEWISKRQWWFCVCASETPVLTCWFYTFTETLKLQMTVNGWRCDEADQREREGEDLGLKPADVQMENRWTAGSPIPRPVAFLFFSWILCIYSGVQILHLECRLLTMATKKPADPPPTQPDPLQGNQVLSINSKIPSSTLPLPPPVIMHRRHTDTAYTHACTHSYTLPHTHAPSAAFFTETRSEHLLLGEKTELKHLNIWWCIWNVRLHL